MAELSRKLTVGDTFIYGDQEHVVHVLYQGQTAQRQLAGIEIPQEEVHPDFGGWPIDPRVESIRQLV